MKRLRLWSLGALLAASLAADPALARDFYVVPKAEADADRADGSLETPFPTVWAALRSGAVSDGDRIILRDGSHGRIKIVKAVYDPAVEIVAENPSQAHAQQLLIQGSSGLRFHGIGIWPTEPDTKPGYLIEADKNSTNLQFDGMDIRGRVDAADTYMDWPLEYWVQTWRAGGIRLRGPDNAIFNSTLTGVAFGITTMGDRTEVRGNRVDGFSGDAMRGLGDGSIFANNHAQNSFKVDDNHDDGFQSWATKRDADGRKTVSDIIVENNTILEWVGPPNHPLRGKLQGIGLFDGMYRNFTIRNNMIAINAYHGISIYAGVDSTITNNTVVNISGMPAGNPWIMLSDNRNGWESGITTVTNNVAMGYRGIPDWKTHNMGIRTPSIFFRNPLGGDFRPKPGGPLVDAGILEGAPETDMTGAPRDDLPDLGAFEAE